MTKPKPRELLTGILTPVQEIENNFNRGRNLGIEEMEEFLPSVEELNVIIQKYFILGKRFKWFGKERFGKKVILSQNDTLILAKEISRRLKG